MAIPITHIISNWAKAFPFCSFSANEFYSLVETIVKSHCFPDIKVERVTNKEGGMLSSSREYLRVKHKDLVFEICAMQFGKDFCISSWLYETEGTLRQFLKFTKAGEYLSERAAKRTFYQADEEAMFKFCVHNAVLEAADAMSEQKGLRKMNDIERQLK